MASRLRPVIYSETNAGFALDSKKQLYISTNGDTIADSIRNIIFTRKGERVMQPDFGSRLYWILFEPMDTETANLIGEEIFQALEDEEDRITIDTIKVTPNYEDNAYDIEIDFKMVLLPENLNRLKLSIARLV